MKITRKQIWVSALIAILMGALIYLGWRTLSPASGRKGEMKRGKLVSIEETVTTLDSLRALRQSIEEFTSKIKDYVMSGEEENKKSIEKIQYQIVDYEKRYHMLSQSPEKVERYESMKFFREKIERMALSAMDNADAQRIAIKQFDQAYLSFMARLSEARQTAEWRVQMALRRSNIRAESGIKMEFDDTLPVLHNLADIRKWMGEIKASLQGYKITGEIEKRAQFKKALRKVNNLLKRYGQGIKVDEETALLKKMKFLKIRIQKQGYIVIQNQDTINRTAEIVSQTQKDFFMVLSAAEAQENILAQQIEVAGYQSEQWQKQMLILISALIFLGIIGLAILLVKIIARPSLSRSEVQLFRATSKEILSLEGELMRLRKQLESGEEIGPSTAVTVRQTILIVDKDADYAQELAQQFKDLDYRVFRAFDDKQAIIEVLKIRPDLIVADAQTAMADQYELLKKYKEDQESIPIIMIKGPLVDLDDLKWSPLEFACVTDKEQLSDVIKLSVKELNQYREQKQLEKIGQQDKHILIVHEDAVFAQIFSQAFKLWKYPVTIVESCEQAIKSLQFHSFKLLLLNFPTADMEAGAFSKKVKKLSPQTSIITMCERSDEKDVNPLKHLGAYVSIWKPFDLDDVREIVDNFFLYDRKTFSQWFSKVSAAYKSAKDKVARRKKVA